jgi:hypothetical protein
MAGNGWQMTEMIEKQSNQKKSDVKTRRQTRGRTSKTKRSKKRLPPPGRGATNLRSAVNTVVDEESLRIAKALVNNTCAGNMAGARLLLELAGADKPPAPAKKKRRGLSIAQSLALEPEWTPECGGKDLDRLPLSEPDWPNGDETSAPINTPSS